MTFDLFYGEVACLFVHLYGKKLFSEFQMTSPLDPLSQCCSNFIWSPPGAGEWKIANIVAVYCPGWAPCPLVVKTFKNVLFQNQGCLVAESLHKSSRRGGLPKLLKYGRTMTFDFFKVRWSLLPYGFVWEKMLRISNDLLWSPWASVAQIPFWASLEQGNERLLKWLRSIDQDGRHAHVW